VLYHEKCRTVFPFEAVFFFFKCKPQSNIAGLLMASVTNDKIFHFKLFPDLCIFINHLMTSFFPTFMKVSFLFHFSNSVAEPLKNLQTHPPFPKLKHFFFLRDSPRYICLRFQHLVSFIFDPPQLCSPIGCDFSHRDRSGLKFLLKRSFQVIFSFLILFQRQSP